MDTRIINSVSGRLSLRAPPQRESLEALAKAIEATDDRLLDQSMMCLHYSKP